MNSGEYSLATGGVIGGYGIQRNPAELDGVPPQGEVRCLCLEVSLPADLHVSWV